MDFLPAIFIILAVISTFLGGLFSFRHFCDRRHLILGFTAGVLLAVVAFDIFPEIIGLVSEFQTNALYPMIALVVGFLIFHIVEKWVLMHHAHESDYGSHTHPTVGILSALALSAHSFLDGVGIGLGFQVSSATGILVAIAVIAHDFSDGLNTVSLMLVHKNTSKKALAMLFVDAIAPILGGLSTLLFSLPENYLVIYLGFFAGFLLYIGASDILPEAHSKDSSVSTILATVFGVVFIYVVSLVVSAV